MSAVNSADFWKDETVIPEMHKAVRNVIDQSTIEHRYIILHFLKLCNTIERIAVHMVILYFLFYMQSYSIHRSDCLI